MNKNAVIAVVVVALVLIVGGGLYYKASQSSSMTTEDATQPTAAPTSTDSSAMSPESTNSGSPATDSAMTQTAVKEFTVDGSNFKFAPSTLTVNKGDTVKITFKNSGGQHDFVIDEFNVKTSIIGSNQQATVQFVADKTGTFDYYCSVGNHRAMGMQGTLTVQ